MYELFAVLNKRLGVLVEGMTWIKGVDEDGDTTSSLGLVFTPIVLNDEDNNDESLLILGTSLAK